MAVIYLDLHDVLADWECTMLEAINANRRLAGKEEVTLTWLNYVPSPESRSAMIREVYEQNPNFFSELPITEWADGILWMLSRLQGEHSGVKVHILSALGEDHPNPEEVVRHNNMWLEKLMNNKGYTLPKFDEPIYVTKSSDKTAYAHERALLIDNFKRNVVQFKEAGGNGIVYTGLPGMPNKARDSYITTHREINFFLRRVLQ